MISNKLTISSNINPDDRLYRYISLSQFISLMENRKLFLKKVKLWDDPWEAPDDQLPFIRDNGEPIKAESLLAGSTVGQCWTYEKDSDAMWRIYSSDRQGIMLETTAADFNLIDNLRHAVLARVIYFDRQNYIEKRKEIIANKSYLFAGDMALKRAAFRHENEVRLLVCLQDYYKEFGDVWEISSAEFDLVPECFLRSITFDPRADNWYVETMKKYCASKGLKCPIEKSTLYQKNFYESTNIVRRYELVEE